MISVIIPARDAEKTLPACLEGACRQAPFTLGVDYELIVVDDGSRDCTAEIAARLGARLIRQSNAGPAAARNAGARAASGDLICFTDADCSPLTGWLAALTAPFSDPEVVGVKGAYRSAQREGVARFVQLEYSYKYLRMARLPRVDFIDTYSAAYRREIFMENGGFDVSFPVPSVEDQEFSFRLDRKGYKMVFAPAAQVAHLHDRTVGEYLRRKFGIGYWKAYLLNWLPERFMSDSHTSPSQRWQILFLALGGLAALFSLALPAAAWIFLASVLAFLMTSLPMLAFIARNDPLILLPALGLLPLRAAALGLGLAAGFLLPHHSGKRPRQGPNLLERAVKRTFDILLSILGLAVTSPLLALAAVLIRLDSPGGVIFSQLRAGEHGRPFRVYKLRTMVTGAEARLSELIDVDTLAEPVFKIQNDPRVTRVGGFLRRSSLDELPQLWNVLRGEMSLVGPRPEETWLVERYNDTERQRLAMKPGLTGPMQVSGRGSLNLADRVALELEYIHNYSLWKDLSILLRSIPAVLGAKGAY